MVAVAVISAVVLKVVLVAQPFTSVTVIVCATNGVTSISNDWLATVQLIVSVAVPSYK